MSALVDLFEKLRTGDVMAAGQLTPVLYDELRRIAARRLRAERVDHTLQATALVHEAYLKLLNAEDRKFVDEVHFLAVASRAMRQVLVDYARSRSAKKRAGEAVRTEWTANLQAADSEKPDIVDLLELNAALDALAAESPDLVQLLEMRYFGGMTAEETAEALGKSVHVVRHDLRFAQAWLRRKMAS